MVLVCLYISLFIQSTWSTHFVWRFTDLNLKPKHTRPLLNSQLHFNWIVIPFLLWFNSIIFVHLFFPFWFGMFIYCCVYVFLFKSQFIETKTDLQWWTICAAVYAVSNRMASAISIKFDIHWKFTCTRNFNTVFVWIWMNSGSWQAHSTL